MCIGQCPLKYLLFHGEMLKMSATLRPYGSMSNQCQSNNVEIEKNGQEMDIKLNTTDFLFDLGHETKTLCCVY